MPSHLLPLPFMRLSSRLLSAAALSLVSASLLAAQGFATKTTYAGPRIWTGNLNGATAIGVQAERGLTESGEFGPGIISGGVGVDWYSWDFTFPGGQYEYSVIPIQAFSNYHFPVASLPKLDPYVGLALVYSVVSASTTGIASGSANASSADLAGQAGARWFLTDKFAVQGQLGFGYGTLSLGATWRF